MSGPWERYQGTTPQRTGPWSRYTAPRPAENQRTGLDRDAIRAQVAQELDEQRAQGIPVDSGGGLPRRMVQGATMGFADEILAGAMTPFEMIRRGTLDPREAYAYSKAREDLLLERAREEGGIAGTVAEIGGGAGAGMGISRVVQAAPQAATAVGRFMQGTLGGARAGSGMGGRIGYGATGGAAFGGVTGAGEAQDGERLSGAAMGATLGAAAGGGLQTVAEVGRGLVSPIAARLDPRGYASRQVARGVSESGQSADDISRAVNTAAADGQPFTVADAMGNPGQRQLSVIARNPGEGRTQVVDFLDARQADQGRRISNTLAEGFDAPQTAEQARRSMTEARRAAADVNYGAAREQAGAVDVTRAIQAADDFLTPGASRVASPQTNIADDTVEATVRRARAFLTDGRSQVSDFQSGLRAKQELDAMIERAAPTVQRQLIPIRNALDDSLASASPPYAQARDAFRQQSQAIDAIDTGRTAAQRGRSEDVIQTFGGMADDAQQGFRVGYADRLIESAQGGAMGANKARPFTSQAAQMELPAVAAPGQGDRMMGRLARENTMFETRAQALGGSRTADNLADNAAVAMDPAIIANVLTGRWGQAGQNALARSGDFLSGSTPAVRQEMARILLQSGGDRDLLQAGLERAMQSEQFRREIGNALLRGGLAGGGAGVNAQNPRVAR